MIWDSDLWREMLMGDALRLEDIQKFESLSGDDHKLGFEIDKIIFVDAYAIRKLIEAKKLLTETESKQVSLTAYGRTESQLTHFNWHHLGKHFDFEKERQKTKSLLQTVNLIIHSFIFAGHISDDHKLEGFWFASDRSKNQWLYYMPLQDWTELLIDVSNSWPAQSRWTIDPDTQEEKIINT